MDEAAAVLGCARSRVSHIETGRNPPRKPDLEVLLRHYGALDRLDTLEELRREGGKRGWWSTSRLPGWLQAYVGLEADATLVRSFMLELIPGLLQTADYARLVNVTGGVPAEEVERRVTARLRRQQRLAEAKLTLSAVISEGALRRLTDHEVAAEQLRHLEDRARLPNVQLHVLPFNVGVHRSMSGSFSLLSFAPGVSLPIAYQEYAVSGDLVDDQDVVQRLSDMYDALRDQALGTDETLSMISGLTRQLER